MSKAEQLAASLERSQSGIYEAAALLRQQDALLKQALEALEKVYLECEVHSDDGETAMIKASNAIRELEEHLK